MQTATSQVVQAVEEVRAATRQLRQSRFGYSVEDAAGYQASVDVAVVPSGTVSLSTSGPLPGHPGDPFVTVLTYRNAAGTTALSAEASLDGETVNYRGLAGSASLSGSVVAGQGSLWRVRLFTGYGTVNAAYLVTNSEVVRPNPAAGVVKGYHDRPEVDMSTVLELETVDDSPWRRVLVADEEIVDQGNFTPVGQDVEIKPLAAVTTVLDQTGAPWSVTTWAWCAAF